MLLTLLLACAHPEAEADHERVLQALSMAHEADDDVDTMRDEIGLLRQEIDELRQEVSALRLEALRSQVDASGEDGGTAATLCLPAGSSRYALPAGPLSIDAISRTGRALLHRGPDGEFDGFRVSAIRRGSLADSCGLKNGDIVHEVGGHALDSMESAMAAYQLLASESEIAVQITRRGEPVTLTLLSSGG